MDKAHNPAHGIKAMLFDLDGVLVDGPPWHREAFIRAMADFGYETTCADLMPIEGLTSLDKLKSLASRGRAPHKFHKEINAKKQAYMLEIIEKRCKPVDSVIEAIAYAASLMPCGVVTNCTKNSALLMLEKSNIKQFMATIITNSDVDGKVKPHPWPYILGCQRVTEEHIRPKECLAFDDTDRGIISAVDAMCVPARIKKFGDLTKERIEKELNKLRIRL